jgi:hexosaminidase
MREEGFKDEFELQSYFIRRIEKVLNAKGKRLIGWDEILEGGLAPDATVMSWRGMAGGIEAAREGHDVIMTPTDYCYFDYYQSQHPDEPLAIGGFLPIEKVYEFEPVPAELPAANRQHIIGGQANIWTEYIPDEAQLFYMAYPRASAMAEVLWTSPERKDLQDFSQRLLPHFSRLEATGIDPAYRFFDPVGSISSEAGKVTVSLSNKVPGSTIRYTLDGSEPSAQSELYRQPIELNESAAIKAATFLNGEQKGKSWNGQVQWHKGLGKAISLQAPPAEKYGRGGAQALINGVFGSKRQFGDGEWLGFEGKDLEAVIDLGEALSLRTVRCRFFQDTGAWIHFPASVEIAGSEDGRDFTLLARTDSIGTSATAKVSTVSIDLPAGTNTRYLKISGSNQGEIPAGFAGAGYPAWLFAGEIVLE